MVQHPPARAETGRYPATGLVIKWIVVLAPLAVVPWFADIYNLPKMTLFCCGTAFAWIVAWKEGGLSRADSGCPSPSTINVILLVWLALYCVSTVFSVNMAQSVWGQYRFHTFGLITAIAGYSLFFLVGSTGTAGHAVKGIVASGTVIAAVAMAEYFSGGRARINSLSGSPIYYAGFLAPLAPVVLANYFTTARKRWLALFALYLAALIVSMARGAWLAELFALGMMLLFAFREKRNRKKVYGVMLLLVIAAAAFFHAPAARQFMTIGQKGYYSNVSRLEGWKSAWHAIKKRPFTGYGPDNFIFAFRESKTERYFRTTGKNMAQAHAHNDLLQMAATAGIPCAAIYAVSWSLVLMAGIKKAGKDMSAAGICAGMAGLFIYLQFNNGMIGTTIIFWVFAASLNGRTLIVTNRDRISAFRWLIPLAAAGFMAVSILPFAGETAFYRGARHLEKGRTDAALRSFKASYLFAPAVNEYYRAAQDTALSLAKVTEDISLKTMLIRSAVRTAELNTLRNGANPDAWHNYAALLMAENRLTGAEKRTAAAKALVRSIQLDPYNVDALAGLGAVSELLGRQKQAQRLWLEVRRLEPGSREAEDYLKRKAGK